MKTFLTFSFTLCILFGSLTGCHKKEAVPTEPLVFSFQLLNEQGQETTVFAPNQNIIFHFEARNNTNQTLKFLTRVSDLDSTSLPAIYQGTIGNSHLVGKPYKHTCDDFLTPPYAVSSQGNISFTISWMPSPQYPDKEPFCIHATTTWLPKGHYYASFAPTFFWYQEGVTTTQTTPSPFVREFDVR